MERLTENVGVNISLGIPANSSTTDAQNSTLVTILLSGFQAARKPRMFRSMDAARSTSSPPIDSAASRRTTPRGSSALYTAWPNPMIFSPASTRGRTQSAAESGSPMSSIISMQRLGAPPCSGPDSAPMPATSAPAMSAPVLATILEVKVEALNPWSTVATK